jgi:serine/threonine protein kinase
VQGLTTNVGRYELLRELGSGGMATVYLARQTELNRLVALKELAALRREDPSFAQRFIREARLAGSVSHPNVITVYDLFESGGTPYIAMEYADRGSLRPYIGRLSLSQLGGVLAAVLAGLAAAEKQEIVHRDLKPENLLVAGDGSVKISDFGIAKATNKLQTGTSLTVQGSTIGTPSYMAPEQALAKEVGPWTDLYSVGIIAFECVIGVTPFGDTEDPMGILMRQVNEPVPPVAELDPGLDPRLTGWIDWLVAKEADQRPQSADEAWQKLEDVLISLLGSRWRRESQLPPLPAGPAVPGPATPPPPGAPRGPLTEAHLGAVAGVATVPPNLSKEPEPAAKPKQSRRRGRTLHKLVFVGVAVVALAAAALARTGGGSQSPAGTAGSSQSPSAPPNAASGTAPTAAVGRIQAQSPSGQNLSAQAASARNLANRYDTAAAQVAQLPSARVKGGPTAQLRAALKQTAAAYRRAAKAASAGDAAGYAASLADANTSKHAVDAALVAMGAPPEAAVPSQGSSGSPQQAPAGPCAGDSSSDDPSDDSCNP